VRKLDVGFPDFFPNGWKPWTHDEFYRVMRAPYYDRWLEVDAFVSPTPHRLPEQIRKHLRWRAEHATGN